MKGMVFDFLGNRKIVSPGEPCHLRSPPAASESPSSTTSSPALGMGHFLNFSSFSLNLIISVIVVVLICICLMNGIVLLFACLIAVHLIVFGVLYRISVTLPPPLTFSFFFLLWFVGFLIIQLWEFFIHSGRTSFINHMLRKYVLPVGGLPFHSLHSACCWIETFNFDGPHFISFSLCSVCFWYHGWDIFACSEATELFLLCFLFRSVNYLGFTFRSMMTLS